MVATNHAMQQLARGINPGASAKPTPMNPTNVICVVKAEGKEVGRIAATSPNAGSYISELATHYGGVHVEYVEDADAANLDRLMRGR